MKKFIINGVVFLVITSIVISILVFTTTLIAKKTFNYNIPKGKNTLIVGDSQTQYSINDSILNTTFNLSQSGSSTFYSYIKARETINHNPQIDTLVFCFSYGTLEKDKDLWLTGVEKLKYKIRNHFFLFNLEDYIDLLKSSPKDVIFYTPQVIIHNLKILSKGYESLGSYDKLNHDVLEKQKQLLRDKKGIEEADNYPLEFSVYQQKYFLKAYDLCQQKGIQFIVISPPVHPIRGKKLQDYKIKYCEFISKSTPKAILINNFNFDMPEDGFGDLGHLNYKGSLIYSNYLKLNGFKQDLQTCK